MPRRPITLPRKSDPLTGFSSTRIWHLERAFLHGGRPAARRRLREDLRLYREGLHGHTQRAVLDRVEEEAEKIRKLRKIRSLGENREGRAS